MTMPTLTTEQKREKHRLQAIRRCRDAILSLRDLGAAVKPQTMNDSSSEAELRIKGALTEIEAFRALIFTD